MDEETLAQISPGVRHVVRMMNEWGYRTCDSGDGSNYEEGMECALPFPHVVAILDTATCISDSHRLLKVLTKEFSEDVNVEVQYNPADGICTVLVTGDIVRDDA